MNKTTDTDQRPDSISLEDIHGTQLSMGRVIMMTVKYVQER